MAAHSSAPFDRALAGLLALLDGAEPGERLPSITVCARQMQVSLKTMWRAAHRLKEEGALLSFPGRGMQKPGFESRISKPPARKERRWERLARRLENDIINGTFEQEKNLPSLKELSHQYGCCYTSIKQACTHLTATRRLQRQNKRFFVNSFIRNTVRKTIVLITRGNPKAPGFFNITRDFIQRFEYICQKKGFALHVILYGYSNRSLVLADERDAHFLRNTENPALFGFVALTTGLDDLDWQSTLLWLQKFRVPVVVCSDDESFIKRYKKVQPATFFVTLKNNALSGSVVARHLLDLRRQPTETRVLADQLYGLEHS